MRAAARLLHRFVTPVTLLWFCPALILACSATPAQNPLWDPSSSPFYQRVQGAAARLEPGKSVEKALGGGESDSYAIEVAAGQFVHAKVEQLGIDVALTLYAPDGKQIAAMDSPSGSYGLEQISTIAESPGAYRLEIASGDKSAPAGRYRVTISPLRAPTQADRTRIEAERKLAEIAQMTPTNAASRREIAQKYEATLALWRAAGDPYEEALTLNSIGEIHMRLGDTQGALDYWNRALPLYRAAADGAGEGAVLGNIGLAYDALGDKHKALEYDDLALPLLRSAGDRPGEASTLSNVGSLYSDLGDKQKALDFFAQALPLRRAVGDRDGEAATLNNIGETYMDLGDGRKALEFFQQALPLARAVKDRYGEAVTLNNIGFAYKGVGELRKALDGYVQALGIFRDVGDRNAEAAALNNAGRIYADLGQPAKALDYYNQALPLQHAGGDRLGEARTLNSIGRAYDDLGNRQKALDSYNQALPIHRAVSDRAGEAATLNSIGAVYAGLGENQHALESYEQALTLQRAIGDRAGEASTLNSIGAIEAALGQSDTALGSYSRALALAREVQSPMLEAGVSNNLMIFWRAASQPAIAIFFGKQAIDKYQELRANLRGLDKESQRTFLKSKEKTYRALAGLLIAQGRLPEAQQVLDLLKNEEYFDFIRRDGKDASSATSAVNLTKGEEALNREYADNAARVTAIGNEWAALRSKPSRTPEEEKHLADLSEQLKAANALWEKFLAGLSAELGRSKEAQATVENVRENVSGMQRVLRQLNAQSGSIAAALYTLVGEESYRVIVVTPTVMVAREYPIKAEELRKKVFDFREALLDPKSNPLPQAQGLYRILVGPAAQDLAGVQANTLMWSLDDVLRYIPMAALHDGKSYLAEKYRNEVFTPASVASLAERPDVSAWRGVGMGVSKPYGDFSALPSVPGELHRIFRETNTPTPDGPNNEGVLSGETMLDETFTEANMKKALEENYPLIHIASHFDFAPGNETDSFLLLGGKDSQGEHLSLAEMRQDPAFNFADTQLLTLSACNTAVGGAAGDGREVDGLGILAQQKGARAVIASLWSVHDASTGILMQNFYKEWATHPDMPKAEALRQAQLDLLRGTSPEKPAYTHPYYWSGFILIGNWR